MAQLAIKGHKTRGKEVIEILEMLGGKHIDYVCGYNDALYYYVATDGFIYGRETEYEDLTRKYNGFALEEFLEKFPYKVGDRVIHNKDIELEVVKMYWDDKFNIVRYDVQGVVDKTFTLKGLMTCHLQPYKETMENRHLNPKANSITEKIKQETKKVKEFFESKTNLTIQDIRDNNAEWLLNKLQEMSAEGALQTINNLYDELHKPQYPKTYEECAKELGYNQVVPTDHILGYRGTLLSFFQQLLICRDAYWKKAGEQMGLGKSWEPDWNDTSQIKHSIWFDNNGICIKSNRISYVVQHILTFPTEEMRVVFYGNFKELIEACKELL